MASFLGPSGFSLPSPGSHKLLWRGKHRAVVPLALASMVVSLIVGLVVYPGVPFATVRAWLLVRGLTYILRALCARYGSTLPGPMPPWLYLAYYTGLTLDALSWGAAVWCLTPLHDDRVVFITLTVVMAIAVIGALLMQNDLASVLLWVGPMLLPNVVYLLMWGDARSVFGALALLVVAVVLLVHARRHFLTICDLIVMRDQDRRQLRAKAQALHAQTQALEEVRQVSALKSRFAATVSHEMRTPLQGMLGLLRQAQGAEGGRSASWHLLDLAQRSGAHLVDIVNDMLDVDELEGGSLSVSDVAFELHAVLRDTVAIWSGTCQEKALTLRLDSDVAAGTWVMGDPQRLRQVLFNLLGNAVKFTVKGGVSLVVRQLPYGRGGGAGRADSAVDFTVQDSGPGIAAEDLERIFEPYQQVGRGHGGTGLGLTVSRGLCRAMGGDLRCRSALGAGAQFTFTLPLRRTGPPTAPPTAPPARAGVSTP